MELISENYRSVALLRYLGSCAHGHLDLPLKYKYRLAMTVHMGQKTEIVVYYGVEIVRPDRIMRLVKHSSCSFYNNIKNGF